MSRKSIFPLGIISIVLMIIAMFFRAFDYRLVADVVNILGSVGFVGFSWLNYKNKFFD